jgi:hypothetical protein
MEKASFSIPIPATCPVRSRKRSAKAFDLCDWRATRKNDCRNKATADKRRSKRVAAANLAGLDEIHVLLPTELSGAGSATLIVDADGVRANLATVTIAGLRVDRLVISQIFGGGGNSGSPFRNDFIEIFNAGDTPVNLTGWSVQYASATAITWASTPLTSVVLAPGQYYLVQQAGGNNGANLPTPDATGVIAMAAGAGKVALVKSTTPLTGACPNDANIVDLVGYGSTATCFRGTAPGRSRKQHKRGHAKDERLH